jgi:hypothetical protein
MSTSLSLVTSDPADQITIGMASMPEREVGMRRVLEQLLPQCDTFDLSLNGYPANYKLPIDDPKLIVYRNPATIGPHAKLFAAHRCAGYFLTVDDDLIYPAGYVNDMVQGIEKYGRKAFVGYHGTLLAEPQDPMQPPCRCLFGHSDALHQDIPVHMLGTGIFGYHSSTGIIDWRNFEPGKIDDQVAGFAQDHRIPMIVLAHPKEWVGEDKNLYLAGTAMRRNTPASQRAQERIKMRQWKIHLPNCWKAYYR